MATWDMLFASLQGALYGWYLGATVSGYTKNAIQPYILNTRAEMDAESEREKLIWDWMKQEINDAVLEGGVREGSLFHGMIQTGFLRDYFKLHFKLDEASQSKVL